MFTYTSLTQHSTEKLLLWAEKCKENGRTVHPKQYWHLISVFLQKIQSVTMPASFLFFCFLFFVFFPHRNYSLLVMNYYVGNIRPHFLSLQLHTYGKWLGVPHRATLWAIIIRARDAGKSDENRTNRWADFYELCWLSSCLREPCCVAQSVDLLWQEIYSG